MEYEWVMSGAKGGEFDSWPSENQSQKWLLVATLAEVLLQLDKVQ